MTPTQHSNGTSNGTNGHQSRGPRNIIRFQTDKTVELRLDTSPQNAQAVQGNYGTEYQYFCAGGHSMFYADQKLHTVLNGLNHWVANEAICITKTKQGRNNVYIVAPASATSAERAETWEDEPSDAYEPEPPPPPPARTQPPAARQTALPPQPVAQPTPAHHMMLQAYSIAIEIAAKAAEHAKAKHGLLITPEFADIRAIAATIFIQANGGGR